MSPEHATGQQRPVRRRHRRPFCICAERDALCSSGDCGSPPPNRAPKAFTTFTRKQSSLQDVGRARLRHCPDDWAGSKEQETGFKFESLSAPCQPRHPLSQLVLTVALLRGPEDLASATVGSSHAVSHLLPPWHQHTAPPPARNSPGTWQTCQSPGPPHGGSPRDPRFHPPRGFLGTQTKALGQLLLLLLSPS